MKREDAVQQLCGLIADLEFDGTVMVAIDGDAGAGKTTLANEVGAHLSGLRPVIRAELDDFHFSRSHWYRKGRDSPEGFYEDSYDYPRLKTLLLDPLRPAGTGLYRTKIFNHELDATVEMPIQHVEKGAVLIVDGLFMLRPELAGDWDFSIFVHVSDATGFARCASRGDGSSDPFAPSNSRYRVGQNIYKQLCRPQTKATVVFFNDDPDEVRLRTNSGTGRASQC